MRILLVLFLFSSGVSTAAEVTVLSPSDASAMNFKFVAWPDSSASEIEEHKKKAHCTPVELSMPQQISEEHPDWTQVLISGEIYTEGKLLAGIETFSYSMEGNNLAYGCFPLGAEYTTNLTLSYMPTDLRKIPICPVAFSLEDFERFVDF